MFCENCGATMSDDAKFCLSCGTATGAQAAALQTPSYASPAPAPVYAPAQPTYTQPAYTQPSYGQTQGVPPLSVGSYIGMFLLLCIPIVNFILLLVWSFGGNVNKNKKNYARATLILAVIGIVASIVFGSVLAGILQSLTSGY